MCLIKCRNPLHFGKKRAKTNWPKKFKHAHKAKWTHMGNWWVNCPTPCSLLALGAPTAWGGALEWTSYTPLPELGSVDWETLFILFFPLLASKMPLILSTICERAKKQNHWAFLSQKNFTSPRWYLQTSTSTNTWSQDRITLIYLRWLSSAFPDNNLLRSRR